MDKNIIFAAIGGAVVGAVAGVAATYLYFNKQTNEMLDEINDLIDTNEKLSRGIFEEESHEDITEDAEPVEFVDPRELDNNEGVKKYHHHVAESMASAQSIFEKKGDQENVTEGEKALKKNPKLVEDPMIKEISEEKYQEIMSKDPIDGWSADDLTYLYPQDELYYGYGTDNEELAEHHYGIDRERIIGQTWRWATDYTHGESGVGYIYIDNQHLRKVISVEVMVDLDLEEEEDVR